MVEVLITISGDALQVAYNNREPSLFTVAKLLEIAKVNLAEWRRSGEPLPATCKRLAPTLTPR